MLIAIILPALAFGVAVFLWQREIASHKQSIDLLEEQLDKAYTVIQEQGLMLVQKDQDYAALDQGMEEQADAYEQDFLTFKETITDKSASIVILKKMVAEHYDWCLPGVHDITQFTDYKEDPYEETPIFDELVLATG